MKNFLFFAVITAFVFSGCKYEEGPAISIHTKKTRLAGEWKIDKITLNGDDITSTVVSSVGTDYVLHFDKDGTYHEHIGGIEFPGTWTFENKKTELHMLADAAGSEEEHYTILKLKKDELWLKHEHSSSEIYEYHYKR